MRKKIPNNAKICSMQPVINRNLNQVNAKHMRIFDSNLKINKIINFFKIN